LEVVSVKKKKEECKIEGKEICRKRPIYAEVDLEKNNASIKEKNSE
jgi:hypothetical protein